MKSDRERITDLEWEVKSLRAQVAELTAAEGTDPARAARGGSVNNARDVIARVIWENDLQSTEFELADFFPSADLVLAALDEAGYIVVEKVRLQWSGTAAEDDDQ